MRSIGLSKALSFRFPAGFKYFYALGFVLMVHSATADTLQQLSEEDQAAVSRICLPVQYQQGAAAYRECVLAQASVRSNQAVTATSALSFDEQYAIQQVCGPNTGSADSAYQNCLNQQLDGLAQIPKAQLDLFDSDDIYALQQSCFNTQSTAGAKAYRQCINSAARDLQALPRPNLGALTLLERNALQLQCSALHTEATGYRQCLLDAVGGSAPEAIIVAATPAQTGSDEADTELTSAIENTQQAAAANPIEESSADTTSEGEFVAESATLTSALDESESAISQDATESVSEPLLEATTNSNAAASAELVTQANQDAAVVAAASDTPTLISQPIADANSGNSNVSETAENSTSPVQAPSTLDSTASTSITLSQVDAANVPVSTSSREAAVTSGALTETSDTVEQAEPIPAATTNSPATATPATEPDAEAGGAESATSMAKALWSNVVDSAAGLDNTSRIIVAAALALPILLLGFWLLMRGRAQEPGPERYPPGERNPLVDRVGPSQQRRAPPARDFERPLDQTDHHSLSQQADELFEDAPAGRRQAVDLNNLDNLDLDEPDKPEKPDSVAPAAAFENDNEPAPATDESTDFHNAEPAPESSTPFTDDKNYDDKAQADTTETTMLDQLGSTERAGFLAWLNHQSTESRQALAIEFLIYWLAYADERYEPAMKETIFQIQDPDEHERIKRWVLMQDVYAFSDVVYWFQHNSTIEQREQILGLLMALLINENALTPVQNTVLRFLADAFGLVPDRLNALYSRSYGHPMPPLPRVDKPQWWDRQQEDQSSRWDARAVSHQSTDIQNRVKLGLPLKGKIREKDIEDSFRRAATRCHPQRFDLLGKREQSLAQRQFEKFEFAKDSLLEVSV